jgi:hypothetical protein
MRSCWREVAVLAVLALIVPATRADDSRAPPPDPDPGFLEFLGSVDRLSEVNPDYLSQSGAPRIPQPAPSGNAPPAPPPPPPPPPQPPSAAIDPSVPGHE